MDYSRVRIAVACAGIGASVGGCSSSEGGTPAPGADAAPSGTSADAGGTAQMPPMGAANVERWLAMGAYKQWHTEPAVHAQRSPSPHGFDRVYSNAIVNANAASTADWPVGAAAVKELFASMTDTTPIGYAVYMKTQAASASGANWYWYERVPLSSPIPHDASGVVADGLGDSGPSKAICVGCHAAAGSDPAHTPTVNGHDEVYTPLP